jgi:hypothetical protein
MVQSVPALVPKAMLPVVLSALEIAPQLSVILM